ncbi:hypothetical protein, partial [Microcoleus sp. herbarium14]|uniref:hypothetical protein n=1 Tax=Microcoleus sp. herbarium14 TaxID=3055439 RepID=UPI002FD1A76A
MNEERRQAYLNLIESLLNCPSGEESQILEANSELVDAGLVQVMLEEANNLRTFNNLDDANYLMNLAGHLMGTYGNTMLDKSSPSTYLKFLEEVLQVTADSNGNPNVIYPLLRDNLNLVNDNFAVVLRNWAAEILLNLDDQSRRNYIVLAIDNFSDVICKFTLGSRASNLEIAIAGYEVAMTVFTREEYAEYWAKAQNNLGIAYSHRIRGEKADNLERAIAAFIASLEILTREAFPEDWATNQNSLGNAYRNRIRGSKSENLELAIASYQASLEVYTREAFPETWARMQNNLGAAYRNRIKGEKAENLEMAIASYQASLEILTREEFPEDWARSQCNLGLVYGDRIRGQKAKNLELAIAASLASLSIYNREAFPEDWATNQNNLGNAYCNRIRGEKAENLELAIASYQASLEVYNREAFPEDWARSQNNLGAAYRNRILGGKAENLELAIVASLASLEILTREAFPEDWARSQNSLGNAYSNRILGGKAENLKLAIAAFLTSLKVYTRKAFPIEHTITLYNIGLAYRDNSQLPQAYNTFAAVIETVESMRSEIFIGGEADRQKLAEEWNKLYQVMVEVSLEMENSTAALEYVEGSKNRNLVELFHKARSLPENLQQQPISFAKIRSLLAENEAILEWYITPNGFKVFIVNHNSIQPDVWQSSYQDLQAVVDLANEYINDYINEETDNWRNQLESRLEKLAEILHIDEIIARLPENCQKLILVPFRYLHLLPLHALTSKRLRQNAEETGSLLDLFPGGVRYTPSCQLLQLSQRVNPT